MLIIDKLASDLVHWGRLVWEKGSGPPYPFPLYDVAFFLAPAPAKMQLPRVK